MVNVNSRYRQMREAGWSAMKIAQHVARDWEDIYSLGQVVTTSHVAAAHDRVDEEAGNLYCCGAG